MDFIPARGPPGASFRLARVPADSGPGRSPSASPAYRAGNDGAHSYKVIRPRSMARMTASVRLAASSLARMAAT